MQNVLNAVLNL